MTRARGKRRCPAGAPRTAPRGRHHRRALDRRDRRPVALVPGPAAAAAGPGRGRCDARRHRGAGRWPGGRATGPPRQRRRRGTSPGDDRQSRAADQAQGGRSGARRRGGGPQAHRGRHARRGGRGAPGGAGVGRSQRAAGRADLRPHQAAHRARFRLGPEARRGDGEPRRCPPRPATGQARARRGHRRLYGRRARRRPGEPGQGRRRDRHPASEVAELTVKAPTAAQVYQTSADIGEFVSPGVPLLSLVVLADVWLRFDLREDLVKDLKVGDRFEVSVPALGNRTITVDCARSPRAASMPDGAPRARPATSTSGPSRSAPIPSIPCPGCGRA